MATELITLERLRSLLSYNPETGLFTWLVATSRCTKIGKVAGHFGKRYVDIKIDTRTYLAHRLAWLYMTGKWPLDQIDHINLDPHDNRWGNLREANASQNSANKIALATNSCGIKGVRLNPCSKKNPWRADIWFDGKSTCLGTFATKEEAHAAYRGAAVALRGEFARY